MAANAIAGGCGHCGCRRCSCACHVYRNAANLPVGFRYDPKDVDLVRAYLVPAVAGEAIQAVDRVHSVNIYTGTPMQIVANRLPVSPGVWLFLTPRFRMRVRSDAVNRRAGTGIWRPDEKSKTGVMTEADIKVANRYSLTFLNQQHHETEYKMHEYVLINNDHVPQHSEDYVMNDLVLCKIYTAN